MTDWKSFVARVGDLVILGDAHQGPLNLRLQHQYGAKVKKELQAIFNGPAEDIDELKNYHEKNWSFIKGTCLSYTATPQTPVTQLLCDIADYIAQVANQTKKMILSRWLVWRY